MKPFIFVLAALTSGAAMAQNASSATCGPQLTHLQERLYQKAGEGPDALRQFMFIRRGILQLDIAETGDWAGVGQPGTGRVHEAIGPGAGRAAAHSLMLAACTMRA